MLRGIIATLQVEDLVQNHIFCGSCRSPRAESVGAGVFELFCRTVVLYGELPGEDLL